ncbi:MAG: winged helix-turn-helix transcriptional regulator [Candidatus Dormibacter sp.]|uniref:winged helix-turn-helix transcriptional regulator n=1 Tax=Candidatus Dormibacter sp. TaxID=2973982 RepID=UPI000DB3AE35|nr:MAG: MarR family transcriptional regulator [Candidatus Dormibacteraeota bacterium]
MRSYGQFCALAKALDAIGDRWSLLIVRELMLLGPARYTDLLHGLPGIATNLLAARLRHLEEVGVITRELAPPPVATTLFRLTPRGEALVPVLRELGHWGAPFLAEASDDDVFHSYWMALPLELYYRDTAPDEPAVTIELRTGDEPMVLQTVDGKVEARRGRAEKPDAIIGGPPRLLIGVLSGRLPLKKALSRGLEFEGSAQALARISGEPAEAVPA